MPCQTSKPNLAFSKLAMGWGIAGFALAVLAQAPPSGIHRPGQTPPGAQSSQPGANPVNFFRQLLALDQPGLDSALAARPEAQRRFLRSRVQEYAAMPPVERERKLRLSELHWQFSILLRTPVSERAQAVTRFVHRDQAILAERLSQWDRLPLDLQTSLLNDGTGLQRFLRLDEIVSAEISASAPPTPPQLPGTVGDRLASWQNSASNSIAREPLQRFIALPPEQRQRALASLPASQRSAVESSIDALSRLPAEARDLCIDAVDKLVRLSPEERQQFMDNAARWQSMSPDQRASWRRIANHLPMPPVPPGFGSNSRPLEMPVDNSNPPKTGAALAPSPGSRVPP